MDMCFYDAKGYCFHVLHGHRIIMDMGSLRVMSCCELRHCGPQVDGKPVVLKKSNSPQSLCIACTVGALQLQTSGMCARQLCVTAVHAAATPGLYTYCHAEHNLSAQKQDDIAVYHLEQECQVRSAMYISRRQLKVYSFSRG